MKIDDAPGLRAELSRLYADLSKHSAYQTIPDFVSAAIGYQVEIDEDWRGDRVRLRYIESKLGSRAGQWGDFGANTGFFSLSLAHANPRRSLLAIEANPNHAEFIARIADALSVDNVEVLGRPLAIDDLTTLPMIDVLLHLNVLHHAGADFDGGRVTGPADFCPYAIAYLDKLRDRVKSLVFQVGTNLWGDKAKPLIDVQDDPGKLILLGDLLTQAGWKIDHLAYASRQDGQIEYRDVPPSLLCGDLHEIADTLAPLNLTLHRGEFYRRPIFICSPSA